MNDLTCFSAPYRFATAAALVFACAHLGCSASSDAKMNGSLSSSSTGGNVARGFDPALPTNNTNVSLGGTQDIGFFRDQLEAGLVPTSEPSMRLAFSQSTTPSFLHPAAASASACSRWSR